MFFIASASVKHHYMFTSWDSVEANGVMFQLGRLIINILYWQECYDRIRKTKPKSHYIQQSTGKTVWYPWQGKAWKFRQIRLYAGT